LRAGWGSLRGELRRAAASHFGRATSLAKMPILSSTPAMFAITSGFQKRRTVMPERQAITLGVCRAHSRRENCAGRRRARSPGVIEDSRNRARMARLGVGVGSHGHRSGRCVVGTTDAVLRGLNRGAVGAPFRSSPAFARIASRSCPAHRDPHPARKRADLPLSGGGWSKWPGETPLPRLSGDRPARHGTG
jgi:hypothetical protein